MRRIELQPKEPFSAEFINRTGAFNAQALEAALDIVEAVRLRGDEAIAELTERFDGILVDDLRVTQEEIDAAESAVDVATMNALKHAASQIQDFHERQLQQSWIFSREDGAIVGAKITPLDSVGIYVPGGRALYPSTVLMNALPAKVAGVKRIVCTTPPTKTGKIDAAILAACKLAGVTEVYKVGGAQAIAALAYGTKTISPVCKITGPGNAYVAAAKKIVSGDVGIDMIAGPSEVCVIADSCANPPLVAIDLMAQAEHDPLAACYLVCMSGEYADAVEQCIAAHMAHSTRAEITSASLEEQGLIVVCNDINQAIDVANVIAPEHLELHVENAMDYLGEIRNAGAIFLGAWTPEAVGDYVAGPNHTLPTGGTARYASPLSVDEFVKKSSIIQYSPNALKRDAKSIMQIAMHEGLWAHAQSVALRLDNGGDGTGEDTSAKYNNGEVSAPACGTVKGGATA